MKLPKNRTELYLVMRYLKDDLQNGVPISIWANYEDADNHKDSCQQDLIDAGILAYRFDVRLVTFYK